MLIYSDGTLRGIGKRKNVPRFADGENTMIRPIMKDVLFLGQKLVKTVNLHLNKGKGEMIICILLMQKGF